MTFESVQRRAARCWHRARDCTGGTHQAPPIGGLGLRDDAGAGRAQCARRCDFGHQKMALCLEFGRRCCATGPLRERSRVTRVRLGSPDCCSNLLPLNRVWQQVCAQIEPLVWLGMALCRTNLRLRSNRLAFEPWPLSQRRAHWAPFGGNICQSLTETHRVCTEDSSGHDDSSRTECHDEPVERAADRNPKPNYIDVTYPDGQGGSTVQRVWFSLKD